MSVPNTHTHITATNNYIWIYDTIQFILLRQDFSTCRHTWCLCIQNTVTELPNQVQSEDKKINIYVPLIWGWKLYPRPTCQCTLTFYMTAATCLHTSFITLFINRCNHDALHWMRQGFLTPDPINKFTDFRTRCFTSCCMDAVQIWSIPTEWGLNFPKTIPISEALGSSTSNSAIFQSAYHH